MVDIYELSEEEHRLILSARDDYNEYFTSASEAIEFSWDFVKSVICRGICIQCIFNSNK